MILRLRILQLRLMVALFFIVILVSSVNASASYRLTGSITTTTSSPNVIFQSGNAATSTIFAAGTSARVTTPTSPIIYYPISYNIVTGTYSSGTVPGSVNVTDSNYFVTASSTGANPKIAVTEFTFSTSSTTPHQLNSTTFSQSNIGRQSNFTAWIHDPGSLQLQIITGNPAVRTGAFYTLSSMATAYLAIRVTTSAPGLSTIDCFLQVYVPGTSTHLDYRLTFKIS